MFSCLLIVYLLCAHDVRICRNKVSKTVPEVDQILKRIGDLSLAGYRAIKSGALAWVDHVVVVGMRQTRGDDEVEVLAVKLYKE